MPIVDLSIGVTVSAGDREFIKSEMAIRSIDTSLPIEEQLEIATTDLKVAFDKLYPLLVAKVKEQILAKK